MEYFINIDSQILT